MKRPIRIEDVCAVPWNTPYPEPPEPDGAVPCVCGETPLVEIDDDEVPYHRIVCPRRRRCGKAGPWKPDYFASVAAWNEKITELRKEE